MAIASSSRSLCHHNLRLFFFFFVFALFLNFPLPAAPSPLNADVALLLQIKAALSGDGNPLSSWTRSSPLCSWSNVQWVFPDNGTLLDCEDDDGRKDAASSLSTSEVAVAAYALNLSASDLRGGIPTAIAHLSALRTLDLSSNNLSGGIPVNIGASASLQFIYLSNNQLSGAIPNSLWDLCNRTTTQQQLQNVRLDHNQLSGTIPSPPTPCISLRKLDLSSNLLSGSIPPSLAGFASLADLNLSANFLSGEIPSGLLKLANLKGFDVSDNNLSGKIPGAIAAAGASSYAGNSMLCGPPLQVQCGRTMDKRLIAVLVIGAMSVAVVAMAFCVAAAHRRNCYCGDVEESRRGAMARDLMAGGGGEDEFAADGKLVRFEGGEHLNVDEVLNAPGEVLGKTSYGTVYKAKLGGGAISIALRLLREDTVKDSHEFSLSIRHLANIRCPNIVSLLAYYAGPKGEKLLVYDYLSRGSLADLLHLHSGVTNRAAAKAPLSWARRHKIVLGAARGLAHLHYGLRTTTQIVHGNLKSKNIIVDESFEGHLADYGLPLLMNSAAQNEMLKAAAAQGYKAPEFVKMSRANPKTDVYNMGIVLLEILTGRRPREAESPEKVVVDLPVYVKQAILEERVADIFDVQIVYGMPNRTINDGLVQALQLAMGCCAPSPSDRPDMKEVVRRLEDIRPVAPTPHYTPTSGRSPRDVSL